MNQPPEEVKNSSLPEIKLGQRKGFKSSDAHLIVLLYRGVNPVPQDIPDNNTNLKKTAATYTEIGQLEIKSKTSAPLTDALNTIKSHLDILDFQAKRNPNAAKLKELHNFNYLNLGKETDVVLKERETLSKNITEFKAKTDFEKINQAIAENKPEADIKAMLAPIESGVGNFDKQLETINKAENKLLANLTNLSIKTSADAGVPYTPKPVVAPPKPT